MVFNLGLLNILHRDINNTIITMRVEISHQVVAEISYIGAIN
jgi:hypothetical protein